MKKRNIVEIIVCIVGIGGAFFLSWLRSEVYSNNGLIFVISMIAFLSSFGLVKNIEAIIKDRKLSADEECVVSDKNSSEPPIK